MSRLLEVGQIDEEIEAYLERQGRVFKAFRQQDSGCISCGVMAGGRRWFVEHPNQARDIAGLRRAHQRHTQVDHPALACLYNSFRTPGGLALVYEWLPESMSRDEECDSSLFVRNRAPG